MLLLLHSLVQIANRISYSFISTTAFLLSLFLEGQIFLVPKNCCHVRFSSATLELQLPLDCFTDQCFRDEPPIVTILQKQRAANCSKILDEPPVCMTRPYNQCCKGNINAKPSDQDHNSSSFSVSVLENIHVLVGLEFIHPLSMLR